MKIPDEITIEVDERRKTVRTEDYVRAKTKQLREFGYPSLTEDTVREQLGQLLAGEKLSVIGMFMEGEVIMS